MSTNVASFTIVLVRGAVYAKTFTLTDDAGAPVPLDSSSITVVPNGSTQFSWTQANGKFTNTGPGVYNLALTAIDTASYTWDSGQYMWSVVEGGEANPCLIEGLVFVKPC